MTSRSAGGSIPRVVVGVDGSPGAAVALEEAAREAAMRGALLDVVHVWHSPYAVSQIGAIAVIAEDGALRDAAASLLDGIVDGGLTHLEPAPQSVEKVLIKGSNVARLLVEVAEDAELLVVGSRGRGGFTGLLLGSVSQQCAHHATCPVLLVPTPDD